MSQLKKQLALFAKYPNDAYISSKRMVNLLADVLDATSHRPQISLYADTRRLYMRNNVKLNPSEYIYLLRLARRPHGTEGGYNRIRWTYCWQGSAIYFHQNAKENEITQNQPLEFVIPEVECTKTKVIVIPLEEGEEGEEEKIFEKTSAHGPILDVIKALSIDNRNGVFYVNNGLRTAELTMDRNITAHFAIAVARATGKHADKAALQTYCRTCDREVMMMTRFKVTFALTNESGEDEAIIKRVEIE